MYLLLPISIIQKHCFYESAADIPLIINVPVSDIPVGQRSQQLCTLIDSMPTVDEHCNAAVTSDADGSSLVPALRGELDKERAICSEFHECRDIPGI